MTDEGLIRAAKDEIEHLKNRGMPNTAAHYADLINRFTTLKEAHRLLAEREQRLTDETVAQRRELDSLRQPQKEVNR